MMLVTCRCGAALVPTARSCGRCGARPLAATPAPRVLVGAGAPPTVRPAPAPPSSRVHHRPASLLTPVPAPHVGPTPRATDTTALLRGLAIGAVVVSLVLAGAVMWLLVQPARVVVAPAAPSPTLVVDPGTRSTASSSGAAGDDTSYVASSGSTDTEATSAELLREGVAQDGGAVEALAGSWVPQLSAKKVGTVAGGIVYDSTAILTHYNELLDRFPQARLLWSGDWPVFTGDDYWVVVAAQPFSTAAATNAWCDAQGFSTDDCMAKHLTHSGGPSGATVPRS